MEKLSDADDRVKYVKRREFMKRKMKQIVAVVAAMIMVLSMGMISVNAAEIQPRLPLCPDCGAVMHPQKTYGKWSYTDNTRKCTHGYKYGVDKEQKRKVTTVTSCSKCSRAYPPVTSIEVRFECHGYN